MKEKSLIELDRAEFDNPPRRRANEYKLNWLYFKFCTPVLGVYLLPVCSALARLMRYSSTTVNTN